MGSVNYFRLAVVIICVLALTLTAVTNGRCEGTTLKDAYKTSSLGLHFGKSNRSLDQIRISVAKESVSHIKGEQVLSRDGSPNPNSGLAKHLFNQSSVEPLKSQAFLSDRPILFLNPSQAESGDGPSAGTILVTTFAVLGVIFIILILAAN